MTGLDLNPGMLAVARALPPPGAPVTRVECSATSMHLADATYDVVLCQQGLQFFPDRSTALQEMRRVLIPGGRVVLSIWKQADPYSKALRAAVERYIGTEAAGKLQAATSLGNTDALRRLMVDAGFHEVHIRSHEIMIEVLLKKGRRTRKCVRRHAEVDQVSSS